MNYAENLEKIRKDYEATTKDFTANYHTHPVINNIEATTDFVHDVVNEAGNTLVLSLAKTWVAISPFKPATTREDGADFLQALGLKRFKNTSVGFANGDEASTRIQSIDESKLYYMKLGEYVMPISQTFTLKAKKNINVSSLVDGIDIIQQVRSEAKTINCVLKLALNESQLGIADISAHELGQRAPLQFYKRKYGDDIQMLNNVLTDLYDSNAVFMINNSYINEMFNVEHVIMTEYEFKPRVSSNIYEFDFSLMEVEYGANVMTLDLGEVKDGQ